MADSSPHFASCAPTFEAGCGSDYRLGMFVRAVHLNQRGFCHGGVLCTLADVYLGHLAAKLEPHAAGFATIALTMAFLKPVSVGDWLECSGSFDRIGTGTATGTCLIVCKGAPAARAVGTFRILDANRHQG